MLWDDLRYFLAVARAGTLSKAARELGVSHATVIRRVDQLETDTRTRLFRRLQSGYQLTEDGERLLPHAAEMEKKAHLINSVLTPEKSEYSGRVRISQPENTVINLYPLYQQFISQYPGITLEVDATPTLSNLNQHEADIAIRVTDQPPATLVGRRLGKLRYRAYAHRRYLQSCEDRNVDELDWVIWRPTKSDDAERQEKWLQRNVGNPRIVMRASSIADVLLAVRAGLGVGVLTDVAAQQYPDLTSLDLPAITSDLTLWLLTHRDLRHVPRIKLLMQFVAEGLRAQRASN